MSPIGDVPTIESQARELAGLEPERWREWWEWWEASIDLTMTPGAIDARCLAICEGLFDALILAVAGVAAIALIGVSWPNWLPPAR